MPNTVLPHDSRANDPLRASACNVVRPVPPRTSALSSEELKGSRAIGAPTAGRIHGQQHVQHC